MSVRIVVLDGATLNPGDNPWTRIEEQGELTIYGGTDSDQIVERLDRAHVAITNKVPISADSLDQLPDLRFIAVTATGYDCVDVAAAGKRGIPVSNVPTYGTDSVAQYAFALLLELCHQVALHSAAVHEGEWSRSGDFSFWKTPQIELAGLTLGIIGFGRIGRRVGEISNVLGMKILAADPFQQNPPPYESFAWASVDEIAERSDAITLHCNLTEENHGLIGADFLSRMKSSAFVINAARGPLVDDAAMADALNSDAIAGAALDVVSTEPITADNPLLGAKNCILTPHMAWSTGSARRRMMETTSENIRAFLDGAPTNLVNSPAN